MFGYKSIFSVSSELREWFSCSENNAIKFVILSYNKKLDVLRLWFFSDMKLVTPLDADELILVSYYAPRGNWDKYYGDEFCWFLTCRRIALDILNNTLLYNSDFAVDGRDVLPSWLRAEIEGYF